MYIGKLNASLSPKFTYGDSSRPFLPTKGEDGQLLWEWDRLYDSVIDITYTLPQKSFVGSVSFALLEDSQVRFAQVLVDGVLSGFHYAETGKTFGGEHTITVGAEGTIVTLRFGADLKNIALYEPEILGAYCNEQADVWPVAKHIASGQKTVAISGIDPTNDPDEAFAAAFLTDRLSEELEEPFSTSGVRVKIEKTDSPVFADEEYQAIVDESGVLLKAKSRLALLYAADALLQLRRGNAFATATVQDKPDKPFRGVHIGLPKLENFEFTRRLFADVLIPLRYNAVIIEFAGGMRFERRPEISEAWLRADKLAKEKKQPSMPHSGMGAEGTILEKDDVRRLVGFAKELGLEVIPEVQSLGHVQYLTYTYPEIAEIDPDAQQEKDLRAEDAKPNQFFHHCYCPSLDKSYEIIFDVIDEIVEVVQPPRYVHIGHDEVYQIGLCPRCRNTAPDVLFEKHVRALYDHIKAKGLQTMLWADMLIREKRYATVPARDRLPKDIVALDFIWYFAFGEDTEQVLLDRNFPVAVGNLYSSHFPRYLSRMNREGMIGGQISMWVRTEEKALATIGKFYDMAYLSQMLWNAENYDEGLRPVYARIVGSKILPYLRERLHGTYPKKEQLSTALSLPIGGEGVPQPILQKYPQAIIADNKTIPVGTKANRLIFTHATVRTMPRTYWLEILQVGAYQVHYADGTAETIDLGYGTNALAYNATYGKPLPQQYYRHYGYIGTWFADPVFAGKSADGNDLTLLSMPWDNPHPEKEITSVTYVPNEDSLTELILAEIRTM